MSTLGHNITRLRTARNWTKTTLAQHAGISSAYLVQLEHGDRNGSVWTHKALADALGVTVEDLRRPYDPAIASAETGRQVFTKALEDLKRAAWETAGLADNPTELYVDLTYQIRELTAATKKTERLNQK